MRRLRRFAASTTARLAVTYLLIIMVMSVGFSVVFYNASLHTLRRQVPPNDSMFQPAPQQQPTTYQVHDFLAERAAEGRRALLARLIVLNVTALIIGGGLSYYLARRTLQPIEQAMEAQARFVSDASHELRTPLTSIRTMNDVALRDKRLTLAGAKRIIADNTEEADKLKQLSDGLLNLAQNDQSAPIAQPTSVQSAVADAINQIIAQAQLKDISIDDQTADEQVLGNQAGLTQTVVILLDNAVKYSPAGSVIDLRTRRSGNQLAIEVIDHGAGIRASDIPHIFDRFYRSDSARGKSHQPGYGLGLAIASNLARHYDMTLTVRSQLGRGSTFTIMARRAKS